MTLTPPATSTAPPPRHVGLVALPDAVASTLFGLYDVINSFALMDVSGTVSRAAPPFRVEIVGEAAGELMLASGVPIEVQRGVDDIARCDIVIVPSLLLHAAWRTGRYPRLVAWLRAMHEGGALLCSACSGIFLLAETGLYTGCDATVHFGYARNFAATFPAVPIHPERPLVVSGLREELICSGASTSWHDLALYLIARHAGAIAAQDAARMFALQWHQEGLTPYIIFEGRRDHGDAEIEAAQTWLASHFSVAAPVEEMIRRSALAERTFKRRFATATGLAPIAYVQRLRIEEAKRRLERSDTPVEEIGWQVGYEDGAFFRRLFKRLAGLSPGAYRKRFRVPRITRGDNKPRTHAHQQRL